MAKGNSKLSKGGGGGKASASKQPNVKTTGDISFTDMMAIANSSMSDGSVSFDKTNTLIMSSDKNGMGEIVTGKKNDIGNMLAQAGVKSFVGNMYRDKSGANDLKRLEQLGYKIQAQYKAPATNSRIPPRDYYYFVKK